MSYICNLCGHESDHITKAIKHETEAKHGLAQQDTRSTKAKTDVQKIAPPQQKELL